MSYNINLGSWGSVFAVPAQVVDEDLKLASAYQLKVLLYILRHNEEELSNESIGKALNMHPSDVKDSLEFWIDRKLIIKNEKDFVPKVVKEKKTKTKATESESDKKSKTKSKVKVSTKTSKDKKKEENNKSKGKPRIMSRPQRPDSFFVAKRINQDPELAFLMEEAQVILGRPLSSGDSATLLMLRDTDGLPADVLIMLMQYCVSIDRGNMRTIERIGISWANEGIVTHEAAENKIKETKERNSCWGRVSSIFGIKNIGSPTQRQMDYASKWIIDWKFSTELLRDAYERCVDTKGEANIPYIDGILRRWHADGIKQLSQVKELDNARQKSNKKDKDKKKSGTSYDLDQYESKSIFDD